MMTISVAINGDNVTRIRVKNCGHPKTGDHPEHDDLRRYEWEADDGLLGQVFHYRKAGASVLGSLVLSDHEINGRLKRARGAALHQEVES